MIEKGKVIKLSEKKATILISPSSKCGNCANANICNWNAKNQRTIELPVTIPINEGDDVIVEISPKYHFLSVFLIFLLPVILLTAGVVLGIVLQRDLFSFIFGSIGFILALGIAKFVNNRLTKTGSKVAKIVRKVSN
ncbi:MAG: SoxR reducing system RseC family protein [candidate division WOR-3 bacterium]|nr:SoxR reducing system RseC family protein [candidate division WOR-3 bacterium]MCX7757240.1 SoxR reducing system RseC family protein [candidate division WOR-3 bacterium]MDW7987584.1 SoxR reducing system RseC family protein [candidate division WOR-3 bacterium]